ncbi:hypothetical protein [Chondromyces crocatus]|uniref:Uncharacterized protein n=1 Tax=Chondromyces crocatus TaxID=52 RepID=A0A0K1EBG2_CHOCO|nr:hypothetical protein [Chondromyces crocatus]AKT38184.1 uncharacterized protein CMC5_023270 [Chondromyces crocatus]
MTTTLLVKQYAGELTLDLTDLQGSLVDLPSGGMRGLRREKPGWDRAEQELSTRLPLHAAELRVAPDLGTQISTLNTRLARVRAVKRTVEKLAEVAAETEAYLEDQREALVGLVVDSVRKAAKRTDPALMTAFEKTIRYHGQTGLLAAKTRRKNEAATAEEEEAGVPFKGGAALAAAPEGESEDEPQET